MKIAIPMYEGSISPVFDNAKHLVLIDVDSQQEVARTQVFLQSSNPDSVARHVADLGVDTLICGAISRPLESILLSIGVDVVSHTCGDIEEVLHAFLVDQLDENAFVMPGCQRRGRRRKHHRYPQNNTDGEEQSRNGM